MYGPYSGAVNHEQQQLYDHQQNLRHPQPQHPVYPQSQYGMRPPQAQQQQQQGFQPQQGSSYQTYMSDPTASLAGQFAKTGLESSNKYLKQNFDGFFLGLGDIQYYFKVSNSYVFRKILLILFPYRNKNWTRVLASDIGAPSPVGGESGPGFVPPTHDINAPDLYIPIMSFMTYILLWASIQGINKQFHPQLFGVLASQTLAFSILDIAIFRVGLYLLNCSTQSSMWDLVSFSGYKYVSVIVILCWKHFFGARRLIYWPMVFFCIINLLVFLMRSLKFMVLPNGVTSTANSITSSQRRLRIQFLFVYAVIVQGLIILVMSL